MNHIINYIPQVRAYFQQGKLHKYPKGTQILNIENDQDSAYLIADGYLRIYSTNGRNGQTYTHTIYGPGEIFPVAWLIEHGVQSVIYEALTDVSAYHAPLRQFTADLASVPKLSFGMLQQTVEQYRFYTTRVDNLEYKYASERLAYCLILFANRFGESKQQGMLIIPPLTHQLLGSLLNLSRESVSREMEKLLRRQLVVYNDSRQIIIPNISELAQQMHVPLHQGRKSGLV